MDLSVEEVRKIGAKLWQIAHTCGGAHSEIMIKTQATADKLAIKLASSVGLNHGDFDFDEVTGVPDPNDV